MTTRETHLVELVDDDGNAVGSATVSEAHAAPGALHRAFSVLLVDYHDRLLLQQRAAVKTRFALRWANATCGHPAPGESVVEAATRRLAEEIGVRGVPLNEIGVYVYRAEDNVTGRVEHEYDHVLLGRVPSGTWMQLDRNEVAAVRWVAVDDLRAELESDPSSFAPWLAGVLAQFDAPAAEPHGGR